MISVKDTLVFEGENPILGPYDWGGTGLIPDSGRGCETQIWTIRTVSLGPSDWFRMDIRPNPGQA